MATIDGPMGRTPLVFYASSRAAYLEPFALTPSNLHPDRGGLGFTTPEPSIWIMPGAKD